MTNQTVKPINSLQEDIDKMLERKCAAAPTALLYSIDIDIITLKVNHNGEIT